MKIVLPFPPSVNQLYGNAPRRQRFLSKKYKDWIASCGNVSGDNIDYPVSVTYTFFFPDKRCRDVTNYVKAPEDFLVHKNQNVLKDDSWEIVKEVHLIVGGLDRENPRVEIKIKKI